MKLENLITKKKRLDRRTRISKQLKNYTATAMLSFLLTSTAWGYYYNTSPKPLKQTIPPKVEEVKAKEEEPDYTNDPLKYARWLCEQEFDSYKCTTFIKIGMCESHFNPDALNKNTNGTFDVGIFQINTIHKQKNMTDPIKNINFAFNMFKTQGTTPWNSSKKCWNK